MKRAHNRLGVAVCDERGQFGSPTVELVCNPLSSRNRVAEFISALRILGATPAVGGHGDYSYDWGREMGERLLAETERPDGIFCANDVMAAGFMDLWQERVGLRAPRDYRIIGFDNTPIAAWSNYSMTSFDQDVDRMARIAVDMLCNFETTRDADRVVRANLVMRSSC